jgi:transcription elongation factor Elf1
MWCPRCSQGDVVKCLVKKVGVIIFICRECEAFWLKEESIGKELHQEYVVYMESQGYPGLWSELECCSDCK